MRDLVVGRMDGYRVDQMYFLGGCRCRSGKDGLSVSWESIG
jgi:hypothetical protein